MRRTADCSRAVSPLASRQSWSTQNTRGLLVARSVMIQHLRRIVRSLGEGDSSSKFSI